VPGFPKHLIFYRVDDDRVEVVRVIHGARDLAIALEDEG
jgi:plasmid stabilization system protein ParE